MSRLVGDGNHKRLDFRLVTDEELDGLYAYEREVALSLRQGMNREQLSQATGYSASSLWSILSRIKRIVREHRGELPERLLARRRGDLLVDPESYGPGLSALDRAACSRCGLRGHLPGDQERCLGRASDLAGARRISIMEAP